MKGRTKMARRVKKIGRVISLPEVWSPVDEKGDKLKDAAGNIVKYHLGSGKIKIFNLLDREEAEIREKTGEVAFANDANGVLRQALKTNEIKTREEIFLARTTGLDSNDRYWEGFFDDQDPPQPMACTEKNLRIWAYETPIYLFVCYVGKLLDAEAEQRATESEKNLLNSLSAKPDSEKPQSPETEVAQNAS